MKRTDDANTNQVSRRLQRATATVETVPFMSGVELEVTLVSGSSLRVAHGLGRKWRGYIVLAQFNDGGADGRYWAPRASTDDKFITIHADGYTTNPQLLLWVF